MLIEIRENDIRFETKNRLTHLSEEVFPFSGTAYSVHVLRIFSIFFGIITLIFIYKITQLIFPHEKWHPKEIEIQVSDADKNMITKKIIEVSNWQQYSVHKYPFDNEMSYQFYRITVSSAYGKFVEFSEIKFLHDYKSQVF